MAAKEKMEGDIITTYSDILFGGEILNQILNSKADIGIATDLKWGGKYENRTEHPKSQADNVIIQNNEIVKIKKNISEISENQKNGEFIGIMKFSKKGVKKFVEVFNQLEKDKPSPFHDAVIFEKAYLTDMIQELINQKISIQPIIVEGEWYEIDTLQDLKNVRMKYF